MAIPSRAVVAIVFASASLGLVAPTKVGSLPMATSVNPRVAATNTPVTVSGTGCTSVVDVVETAFLFPGHPFSTTGQTVTPDSVGAWSAVFAMPSAPAYVTATCDGVQSVPIVVAPNDAPTGNMSYAALTPTEIEITTSPLVDGSDFTIFDLSGNVLGNTVAVAGTATVRIPRSLGPAEVIAAGLRQHDPGINLPFVPIAPRVQLPLQSQPSVVAGPRVTASGNPVVASGNCSGTPRLVVTGRAAGWFAIPPIYVDVSLVADSSDSWSTSFPMPPTPSTAVLTCTQGNVSDFASTMISPSDRLQSLFGQRDGSGVIVSIPNVIQPERLVAFSPTGRPVPLALLDNSVRVRLAPPGIPMRIVIIGIETFGENANARQTASVQAWFVDVGSIDDGASIAGLARARRVSLLPDGTVCCPQPAVRIPPP